jgi:hypothetical protein
MMPRLNVNYFKKTRGTDFTKLHLQGVAHNGDHTPKGWFSEAAGELLVAARDSLLYHACSAPHQHTGVPNSQRDVAL